MLLSFKIQAQLRIKGRNGPSEVVMVVDGVKDLPASRPLACTRQYFRLSFTWCERSDILQTSNISWLLNNLHHHASLEGGLASIIWASALNQT